jgi:hypothetical protein
VQLTSSPEKSEITATDVLTTAGSSNVMETHAEQPFKSVTVAV